MRDDDMDDLTENIEPQTVVPAGAHLELQILKEGGSEYRFPFLASEIVLAEHAKLAFPQGSAWIARLSHGSVSLSNTETGEIHRLVPGAALDLDDTKIRLVDTRQAPIGRLEGLSETFTGRNWSIDAQQTWLGRRGKRFNHVEINHPSVSRTHASFLPDQHGRVTLVAESAGSAVSINGVALDSGGTARLRNGDLLTFGRLQFRFHSREESRAGSLLNVNSLGTFQVALGMPADTGVQITTKKARWLLAALASGWGSPKPVETLLEWLWPDLVVERARRNMSNVIGRIRDELGCPSEEFEGLLIRTPSTLGLNPQRLGVHDYQEARKLTQSRAAITSVAGVDRLIRLYRGPYLPTCLEDWAHARRQSLELDVLGTLQASARYFRADSNFEVVSRIAEKCLELDNFSDEAAVTLMEAYLETGRPERALRLYNDFSRILRLEGLEPSTEMIRLQLQATMG